MGDTGTDPMFMYPLLGGTGPTELMPEVQAVVTPQPSYIMTLDQLSKYYDTTIQSETTDKSTMNFIINPSTSGIQQNLIQWASVGFPVNYQVLSIALIHPSPCADGRIRDMNSYISYLTESDITTLITAFQSNFLGMSFSYSIDGNIVNIYASKVNLSAG